MHLHRAQVGEQAEPLAQAQQSLLRPLLGRGVVPLGSTDGTEQHCVRGAAQVQGRVRQWAADRIDGGAADEPLASVQELVALARHPKFVGIGETGLDYHYTGETKAIQQESLRIHIEAARQTGLPLIIHAREADEDMAEILEAEHAKGAFPFLLHCFSSGPELAQRAVAIGGYVSLSGIITFKKADDIRETVKQLPLERLLVETDAPYLAPVPHRGKTNEPAFTAHTAAKLAEIKGVTPEEIEEITTANFHRLFTKVPPL